VSCAKTDKPIEIPFGLRIRVYPRNHLLDGFRSLVVKGNFKGGGVAAHCNVKRLCAVSCA